VWNQFYVAAFDSLHKVYYALQFGQHIAVVTHHISSPSMEKKQVKYPATFANRPKL
jgi:hypothetical protein